MIKKQTGDAGTLLKNWPKVELEIENTLTNQEVLEVIQRGELLTRLANQVKTEASKLGEDAGLIMIQIDSLESGVLNTLNLVLKDHLPTRKFRTTVKANYEISKLSYDELNAVEHLGKKEMNHVIRCVREFYS